MLPAGPLTHSTSPGPFSFLAAFWAKLSKGDQATLRCISADEIMKGIQEDMDTHHEREQAARKRESQKNYQSSTRFCDSVDHTHDNSLTEAIKTWTIKKRQEKGPRGDKDHPGTTRKGPRGDLGPSCHPGDAPATTGSLRPAPRPPCPPPAQLPSVNTTPDARQPSAPSKFLSLVAPAAGQTSVHSALAARQRSASSDLLPPVAPATAANAPTVHVMDNYDGGDSSTPWSTVVRRSRR